MRFVVLHAHPLTDCLNEVLLRRTIQALTDAGHDLEVTRIAQDEWVNAADLVGADGLVFVYPTWWGGLPASLLGWVQHELAPWIDGQQDRATSPLRTVRHLVAVTTHGSRKWVNFLQGESGLHLLRRTIARLCAPRTRLRWVALYGVDQRTDREMGEFIESASAKVARIAA